MKYHDALEIAMAIKRQLEPHCEKIMLVGSLRRRRPEVKDIEFVLVPKPYQIGLFASGIAQVINQWQKIKGDLPCKYTQRQYPPTPRNPEGIKVDLFIVERDNFGYHCALRTGPAAYNKAVLIPTIKRRRLEAKDGWILNASTGKPHATPTEQNFFAALGLRPLPPHLRGDPKEGEPTGYILNTSNAPAA